MEQALIGFIDCNGMSADPGFSTYKNSSQQSFIDSTQWAFVTNTAQIRNDGKIEKSGVNEVATCF